MKRVAVIRKKFLPITETFIYEELTKLKNFKLYVFASERMNKRNFPFPRVIVERSNRKLWKQIRKKKIRLIHARFGLAGIDMLGLKKKLGLPMITSFHGHDSPDNKKNKVKYKRLKQLFREGEMFTVTNRQMKKVLMKHGCPKRKIHIQHSGIDVEKFPFRPRVMPKDKPLNLLFVGRLVEKKGAKYLIKAFKKVHDSFPNTKLTIVGEGELRKPIVQLIQQLGLKNQVKMLGNLSHPEVIKEMDKAHLFCLPSVTGKKGDQEGIPNVLKEAMVCGIPVISTIHAGIPELISSGINGYLVPEKDSDALAKQIMFLIKNHQQWPDIGQSAREKILKDFNSAKQVQVLEKLYRQTITKHKKERKRRG